MENILYNISQVLGITVIHSLWQALLIYFMLKIAMMFLSKLSSSAKYLMAVSALFSIAGWFFYTLITEINVYEWIVKRGDHPSALPVITGIPAAIHQFNDVTARYYYDIEQYLPYIAMLYIAGLLFNTGKLVIARKKLDNIKQNMSIDIELQYLVNKFSDTFGISKKVKIGLSNLVDVPCMAGYIKPVILLPFTLTTYLSALELEAIVLHELAHIKRNDYLVNLLQQVIAILLFFNPCVILINRVINEEREHCCDDLVVKATASPLIYAKALLKLEQTRHNDQKLALAATGKKYYLLQRIERIMKDKQSPPGIRPALLAILILTICIGSIAFFKPEIAHGEISVNAIKPAIKKALVAFATKESMRTQAIDQPTTAATNSQLVGQSTDTIKDDNSNSYELFGYDDPKMDSLSAELSKHTKFVKQYYKTDEYKDLQEKTKGVSFDYSNDTLKKINEAYHIALDRFKQIALEIEDSRTLKKRDSLGIVVGAYYSSATFKALNERLEKEYDIDPDRDYLTNNKGANYILYQTGLKNGTPAQIKEDIAELETLSTQMNTLFSQSGAYQTAFRQFKLMGDSLNAYYNKPHIRQHEYSGNTDDNSSVKGKEKYLQQLHDYINSPVLAREMALEKESANNLFAYMRTPEFQKHLRQWKAQLRTTLAERYDKILHPEGR